MLPSRVRRVRNGQSSTAIAPVAERRRVRTRKKMIVPQMESREETDSAMLAANRRANGSACSGALAASTGA